MERNINLNRPKVSDEEIESRKDFNDLVAKFKKESLQKGKKDLRLSRLKKLVYSTVIAGVTVVCTVTYLNYNSEKNNKDKLASETEKVKPKTVTDNKSSKYIQPITSKTNVAYNKYKVNAKHGATITHNKSKIKIPSSGFVNKKGEDVQGEVEIQYREMHDQADILASGIPMTYDSAGTTYHFESAGMVDIQGSQNGEEIFIKPGKEIKVEMASRQPGSKFNVYVLDTVNKNWVFKGKDKVSSSEADTHAPVTDVEKAPEIVKIDNSIKAIEIKKDSDKVVTTKKIEALPKVAEPLQPRESKGTRPKFELDVDPQEHPELSMYKDVTFEIGEENKHYTPQMNQVTWSDAQLTDGPQKGVNYTLHLILGSRHEKLVVYPALSGKSYEKALKEYKQKFDQYEVALQKKKANEEKMKKELEARIKAYEEEQSKLAAERAKEIIRIRKKQEEELASQFNSMGNDERITRTFMVSNFGVWNTDCANRIPAGEKISASFHDGNSILVPNKIFIVDKSRNLVFTISGPDLQSMSYLKDGSYVICFPIRDVVYTCSPEDYQSPKKEGGKTIFEVHAVNPEVASVHDLRKGLGLI